MPRPGSNERKNAVTGVSARQVAAVVWLARSDPRIAKVPEDFDKDPWLFNTRGGTAELKTGKMREHRRWDYITKITEVSPGGECPMLLISSTPSSLRTTNS
jgi:putative DNA primase/helicase